jgi:hypothetical protein
MNVGFEDSLDSLKLEVGFQGVQKLKPHYQLSNLFPDGPEVDHLSIAVERPIIRELLLSHGPVADFPTLYYRLLLPLPCFSLPTPVADVLFTAISPLSFACSPCPFATCCNMIPHHFPF